MRERSADTRWVSARWARTELVGAVSVLMLFVIVAVAPGFIASADGLRSTSGVASLSPPTMTHPFGTDVLGRDNWARLVYGARTSLFVGALATIIALPVGVIVGGAAASLGGWWDEALMRSAEVVDSIPTLLLALLLVSIRGPGVVPIALVVGLTGWLAMARVARAELQQAQRSASVVGARALGAGRGRIAVHHLAPELLAPLLALVPFRMEGAIVVEAGLSFLGVENPNRPSWGGMLRDAQPLLLDAWWLAAAPIVALSLLLFALSVLADHLQRATDPRLREAGAT